MRAPVLLALAAFLIACNEPLSAPAVVTCQETLYPEGAFRLIYSPDLVRLDTTPRTVNRLAQPLSHAVTVWTLDNRGRPLGVSVTFDRCVTLYDSLLHSLPNARGMFPVP